MKNQLRILALAVILLLGVNSNAGTNVTLSPIADYTLQVEFTNIVEGSTLSLSDNKGSILFTENLKAADLFKRSLSLEEVPSGVYYLTMESDYNKVIYTIQKAGKEINLFKENKDVIFKPQFKKEGKQVFVSLTNPKNLKTKVNVYDYKGELVGTFVKNDLIVKNTLDFSNMPSGTYTIYTEVGGETFANEIRI